MSRRTPTQPKNKFEAVESIAFIENTITLSAPNISSFRFNDLIAFLEQLCKISSPYNIIRDSVWNQLKLKKITEACLWGSGEVGG